MKVCYFAHPVTEYGTDLEAGRLRVLDALFEKVINPGEPEHGAAYKVEGWSYFDNLVLEANVCVYSRFPNGTIGAGVAKEVQSFFDRGLPVFMFLGNELQPQNSMPPFEVILTVEETRTYIAQIRARAS